MVPLYHLNQYIAFYCDYFAQNNSTTYSARGGRSTLGLYCGAFIVVVDITVSAAHWYRGACLSFKLIDLLFIVIIFIKEVVLIMLVAVVHQVVIVWLVFSLIIYTSL